ncbi:PREDICTED: uncharacterized protein LOC108547538 [Eufriesea mexicana]|uniref:uncharacterized protein LOC108547538 n=1 Tax=Eufriesea mexicana TaxID=516756 RepID=UPI00083BFCBB|nr:PREDICTED: uncharacterized protein LOC108547538 [Eufriesea mexicana]
MNYERYYDKRGYGNYVVHFANSNGLNEDTVMNLFSRFGKVVNVNNRGKSYGLCFVSYGSLEDVKRCIAGFENDKVIKILPHINKFNINGGKKHKNKNKSMFTKEFVDQSMHMTSSGKYKSEDQQSDKESNSSITYKLKNSNSSKISSENLTSEDKIFDETKIPPLMPIDRKYTRIHRTSMPSTKFVPAEEQYQR